MKCIAIIVLLAGLPLLSAAQDARRDKKQPSPIGSTSGMIAKQRVAERQHARNQQQHGQDIAVWRHHYKLEFIQEPRSPLKARDTAFLRFYPVTNKWAVEVRVIPTPDASPFDMSTHAGTTKKFRPYALLRFAVPSNLELRYDTLIAYESLRNNTPDSLVFIPFNDETNNETTYGGGRYMDIAKRELEAPGFILDFNKAYNPWCVFANGYSCPIPPVENRLQMRVEAGELLPDERIRAKE